MSRVFIFALLMGGMTNYVWANTQIAKLSVPSMNCAICPITVRKALEKVDGVTEAKVNFDTKTAVVTFDAQSTNIEQLMRATQAAGFPSTLMNKSSYD